MLALKNQLSVAGAIACVSALSLLEPYVWIGALLNELGFHLAILLALGALVAVVRRAFLVFGVLLLAVVLFVWPLVPLYRVTKPTPQAGPLLRVATAHVAGNPLDLAKLQSWLGQKRPDAMVITGLREDLGATRVGAYRVARGNADLRTLLLVQSALVVPSREKVGAHPVVTVRAGRCQARAVGLELPPIAAYTVLDARARAIRSVKQLRSAPRSLWLGHLGSRAEAHDLEPFVAEHALRDGRLGHGRLATAPGALGPLGFPLSDVLVHGWISVREVDVLPPLVEGAHRTLTAVLELTEARCRFNRAAPLE